MPHTTRRMTQTVLALLALAILPLSGESQTIIAHRGLFHNSVPSYNMPENTNDSVIRAHNIGLGGAEVDLRESSDGVVMVTHDTISNRTTVYDNDGGSLNPVDVTIGSQKSVSAIHINAHPASYWTDTELKLFGPNSSVGYTGVKMETLSELINTLNNEGILSGDFKLILDIQDPDIFEKAASIVSQAGVQDHVYLKFFAKKALYDDRTYDGAYSCYTYMVAHHLEDPKLQIIPQINDGELDVDEDDNAGITIWGHTFTITEYLGCWSSTMHDHSNVIASMPIVSASVPADNPSATQGATDALAWAKGNGRQTMSIVPNPDACYRDFNATREYSFSSTNVPANSFNYTARNAKSNFVAKNNPNYVIADVMGLSNTQWTWDITNYNTGLCYNSAP